MTDTLQIQQNIPAAAANLFASKLISIQIYDSLHLCLYSDCSEPPAFSLLPKSLNGTRLLDDKTPLSQNIFAKNTSFKEQLSGTWITIARYTHKVKGKGWKILQKSNMVAEGWRWSCGVRNRREERSQGWCVEIYQKCFSLASSSGVQSLAIDLFKIQSSVLNKLGILKSPSCPTTHFNNQSWVKSPISTTCMSLTIA